MSDELYRSRLRFSGRAGVAKLHGRSVLLATAPDLGAGPVHAVDYVPEVGIAEVVPRPCDPRRDMTPAEVAAADALLAALVTTADPPVASAERP